MSEYVKQLLAQGVITPRMLCQLQNLQGNMGTQFRALTEAEIAQFNTQRDAIITRHNRAPFQWHTERDAQGNVLTRPSGMRTSDNQVVMTDGQNFITARDNRTPHPYVHEMITVYHKNGASTSVNSIQDAAPVSGNYSRANDVTAHALPGEQSSSVSIINDQAQSHATRQPTAEEQERHRAIHDKCTLIY